MSETTGRMRFEDASKHTKTYSRLCEEEDSKGMDKLKRFRTEQGVDEGTRKFECHGERSVCLRRTRVQGMGNTQRLLVHIVPRRLVKPVLISCKMHTDTLRAQNHLTHGRHWHVYSTTGLLIVIHKCRAFMSSYSGLPAGPAGGGSFSMPAAAFGSGAESERVRHNTKRIGHVSMRELSSAASDV